MLEQVVKAHNVPGASLAVWHHGQLHTAASGLLNVDTGVEATTESAFQIGSIAKLFTATLVMQLVEDGLLVLDVPIIKYLPEFGLADMSAARKITLWHLLTHTSGMAGDVFIETGRGEDRHQRFVDMCRYLPVLHPVGEKHSYCNAGWVIAGRIIEVVTNRTWDQLMSDRIFKPLGMHQAFTLPEDALRFRTALGHTIKEGEISTVKKPYSSMAGSPAGATLSMSASDLIRFARMALGGGKLGGQTILSTKTLVQMQSHHFTVDKTNSLGLGWMRYNWSGDVLLGHDGATMGQNAFFRIIPSKDFAIVLQANLSSALPLYLNLFTKILSELADTSLPIVAQPISDFSLSLELYEGHYDAFVSGADIFIKDRRLFLTKRPIEGIDLDAQNILPAELKPINANRFVMKNSENGMLTEISFSDFDEEGRPSFAHIGGRIARRTSSAAEVQRK